MAGPHRYQATWRSTISNRRFDNTGLVDDPAHLQSAYIESDYYLDILDIVRVSAQDYRELRQFLEGAEPNEAFEGLRAITGHGLIVANSVGDLEDKTWAMYEQFGVAACRLASQSTDPAGVLPFDFRVAQVAAPGYRDLRFYCRPGAGRPVVIGRRREGLQRPFIFQLLAMDPFAYSQSETQTALGNLDGTANTVTNAGNVYSRPKYVITCSGAGDAAATLTNQTTGQNVVLDLTGAQAADVYTIDTARATLTKGDGSNQYSKRVSGYLSELYLLPGANDIRWNPATGITSVVVKHRGAWS